MSIYRMNGAGNAFILIDSRSQDKALGFKADAVQDLANIYAFDQLLILEKDTPEYTRLRVWNRDGTEVGACGNGARAAAWLIFQDSTQKSLGLSSLGGPLSARLMTSGDVEVNLGQARLGWNQIPLSRPMTTNQLDYQLEFDRNQAIANPGAVNLGNPHCVFFVDDVEDLPVQSLGAEVETDPLFPQKVNVGFAQIKDETHIRLKVWERGAGLTLACGTGAGAALVAAHRQNRIGREASIQADGGMLSVRWDQKNDVHLSGPVELEGEIEPNGPIKDRFGL